MTTESQANTDKNAQKLKTAAETTAEKAVEGQKKDYFPLMELPREIRDIIYFWAFYEIWPPILGLAARLLASDPESNVSHLRVHINVAFTMMNRQTRAESMPALMSRPYAFWKPHDLWSFLESVGPSNCAFLKNIILENWDDGLAERHTTAALRLSAFRLLAKARLIKSFSVEALLSMRHEPYEMKHLAGCCFDGLRGIFEAISRREGAKDAGMDVFHFGPRIDVVGGMAVYNTSRKAIFEAELRRLLLDADW